MSALTVYQDHSVLIFPVRTDSYRPAVIACVKELVNVYGHKSRVNVSAVCRSHGLDKLNIHPSKLRLWMNGNCKWLFDALTIEEFNAMRLFYHRSVVQQPLNFNYHPETVLEREAADKARQVAKREANMTGTTGRDLPDVPAIEAQVETFTRSLGGLLKSFIGRRS